MKRLGVGEAFRDWSHVALPLIIFPYDADLDPIHPADRPNTINFLSPYKETLENVVMHGTVKKKDTKKQWFEYSRLGREKSKTAHSIAFPEIATHNHAYFDATGILFHQTAPVIKLPGVASQGDHQLLLAILNSSLALFWLKQKYFKNRLLLSGMVLKRMPTFLH